MVSLFTWDKLLDEDVEDWQLVTAMNEDDVAHQL